MTQFNFDKALRYVLSGLWSFVLVFALFSPTVFSAPPIKVTVTPAAVDINLGDWDGSPVFSANNDICVSRAAGNCGGSCPYTVRSQAGAYTATNGIDTVPFQVFYNDQLGTSGNQELLFRVDMTGQGGILSPTCSGVNGNFQIIFNTDDLNSLNPGIYTGTFKSNFELENERSRRARVDVVVSFTIPNLVQITGLNDIPLLLSGSFYQGGDDFCVYRNGTGGAYSVTASSANSAGPGLFTLSSGLNNANYNVFFADTPGASAGSTALVESTASGGLVGTNVYSAVCATTNASVYIEVAAANFTFSGTYGDTLTLTIMPE